MSAAVGLGGQSARRVDHGRTAAPAIEPQLPLDAVRRDADDAFKDRLPSVAASAAAASRTVRRRTLLLGTAAGLLALGALIAGGGSAQAAPATWNLYDGYTQSYFVPYVKPLDRVLNSSGEMLGFSVTLNGDTRPLTLGMDTGSTGIVIGSGSLGTRNVPYNTAKPGWVYYDSSGLLLTGYFTDNTQVNFSASNGQTVQSNVPILIATRARCIDPKAPDSGGCSNSDQPQSTMMGVGFARNTMGTGTVDTSMPDVVTWLKQAAVTPSSLNPFLNVSGMGGATMRAGYIVTPTGVHLGLTKENTTAGANTSAFAYGQLLPLTPSQPNNWEAQPLVISLVNKDGKSEPAQSGSILMDTGVHDGFLTLYGKDRSAFVNDNNELARGVTVTVNLLGAGGLVGYAFTVGTDNPQVPQGVYWSKSHEGTAFFNSSLHTYSAINLLFDAEGGFIGVQLNGYGIGTNAYVTPVLVANGVLAPTRFFSTDLPVIIAAGGATVSTQSADAEFRGDMTGPGSLTITGPGKVTLAGANSYVGGTFVTQGTLALTGTLGGSVTVQDGASFTSQGGYAVTEKSVFTNAGTFTSPAALTIFGLTNNSGTIAADIGNLGTLVNSGTITGAIANSGLVTNSGRVNGAVANAGILNNRGVLAERVANAGLLLNSGTILGAVSNAGTLSNRGLIEGPVSNSGALVNEGEVRGAVVSSGALSGTGRYGQVSLTQGGSLAPGGAGAVGSTSVTGSYSQAAGAALLMDVAASGTSDRLTVGGQAALGGTLALQTLAGATVGATYTLLTAGSISGTFGAATVSNVFLAPELNYGADSVSLTLVRSGVPLAIYATTPNERAVAAASDTLPFGNPLSQALIALSGGNSAAAYKSLSGEAYASTSSVLSMQSVFVRQTVMSRARAGEDVAPLPATSYAAAPSAGPFSLSPEPVPAPQRGFWTEAFGAWGNISSNGNASSIDTTVSGVLVGLDGAVGDWRIGFATGYSSTAASVTDVASSLSADTVHLALYGGGAVGAIALRAGVAYGWSSLEASRTVAFPGWFGQMSSDYSAGTAQLFGEAALPTALGGVPLEPFAGLAYVNVATGGFSEMGGPAALSAASGSDAVTYATLGARTLLPFQSGSLRGAVKLGLAWQHAFGDVTPQTTFSFVGSQPFTIAGVPVAQDAALVEAGLDFALNANVALSIAYAGQLAQSAQENMVKGSVAVRF